MPSNEFKTLWKGTTPLVNLKTINLSYSRNLKIMPVFTNLKLVEKLLFRGCRSHPSIGKLTNLSHLDFGQCSHLKELTEPVAGLTKLGHLDLRQCGNLKRLPELIIQLTTLGSLNLGNCYNLTRLPEQLGDMKCLKYIDASHTAIEQLPDSIDHLKELVDLKLYKCKKLRKLPEQIGNLESLKLFDASFSAIENLLDTFASLVNLNELHLSSCGNLTSLPNSLWKLKVLELLNLNWSSNLKQLGKMQCLKKLYANGTSIEELPNSTGLLSRLQELDVQGCKKMSKLSNLRGISLHNCTSREWSFAELPLNLTYLSIFDYATLEMLPDLSSLKELKSLSISWGISLQSLPLLPPNLGELVVYGCKSLQDLPDQSILDAAI